ncbi:MAG TPA: flagellar protein FlgN [Steroidobacteraceae bacterium]|nr:flagellar protein FlgN [Steroidobacteraceae bacterium]
MNEDARRRLEELLDREIEVAHALLGTLADERSALGGSVPDALEKQAAVKMQLLGQLEKLEDERRALSHIASQTLPGARPGAGSTLAAGVAERWRALMEIISRCRSVNELNGYIINTRRGHIQQLLGAVRGVTLTTYTAQGRTFSKSLRALAKA